MDTIRIQPSIHNQRVFDRAIESTAIHVTDDSIRDRAIGILGSLNSAVEMRGVAVVLPRIITDFGFEEAYYELVFPGFTIGIVVAPDPSEDGWFITTDEDLGGLGLTFGIDSMQKAADLIGLRYGYAEDPGPSRGMCTRYKERGPGQQVPSAHVGLAADPPTGDDGFRELPVSWTYGPEAVAILPDIP